MNTSTTDSATINQLEQRIAELEARLDGGAPGADRTEQRDPDGGPDADAEPTGPSRRVLLRNAALALGTGVAGAAALSSRAAAANGDPILIGSTTTGSLPTEVRVAGPSPLSSNILTVEDVDFAGSVFPAAVAGYGGGTSVSNGLYGYTQSLGSGVTDGYAIVAWAGGQGVLSRAPLFLLPNGGAPTSDTIEHRVGEVVVSGDGRLWYCVGAGTPGTWEELSGDRALIASAQSTADDAQTTADAAQTTADAAQAAADAIQPGPTFLPTSQRAFDSRSSGPVGGGAKGAFAGGENREIDLIDITDVPAGASAVMVNVTALSESPRGFLSLYSATSPDLSPPDFSSVNWFGTGHNIGNTTLTALSPAGKIKIFARNPAHVVLDAIAYYA